MTIIGRIVLAAVVGAVVYVLCAFLLAPLIALMGTPISDLFASFLAKFAILLGVAAAVWVFVSGVSWPLRRG